MRFQPDAGLAVYNRTRRSGCSNGRGVSSVASMTLKTAVLAPMPRARVTSEITVVVG